jgi:hypothetical protein
VLGRAAKHPEPTHEVVDDFPEDITVLPGELTVVETYLAQLLDASLEPDMTSSENETTKRDVE